MATRMGLQMDCILSRAHTPLIAHSGLFIVTTIAVGATVRRIYYFLGGYFDIQIESFLNDTKNGTKS
jgi:hypothetical protein